MRKTRLWLLGILSVGLFWLAGRVLAQGPSPKKGYLVRMDKFGSYSTTANSDQKTTIMSHDGKRVVAELIYSPNKKFHALTDLGKQVTTVCKEIRQGNIARLQSFWVMQGCVELLGLSNDGEYLVTGCRGGELLPLGYRESQVLLSIFKRGRLAHQVRLDQVIVDFSKLRLTEGGYCWGKYLGLNAAGYYVLESVEGEKVLFDVKTGERVGDEPDELAEIPGWKTYKDVMGGYEFQYPAGYLLKEFLAYDKRVMGISLKREDADWLIDVSVEAAATYPRELYASTAGTVFEGFAIYMAKLGSVADGPDGSTYAMDIVKKELFANAHGLQVLELYLLEVHESYLQDAVKKTSETKGPLYAVCISPPGESVRILLFDLTWRAKASSQDKEILKKMVDTVKLQR